MRCGGMKHFILPQTNQKEQATPRYGNVAMIALIKLMHEEGCNISTMTAHIIGGGHPEGEADGIGAKNVEMARKVLKEKGITILSEDVGGSVGRKIVFDLATGHVAVLKVHKLRTEDWVDTGDQ
jgi:chemotaxis protein CheD